MTEVATLARPYAKAAFEQAAKTSGLADWSEALETAAQVTAVEKVEGAISNPSLTAEQKAGIMADLCGDKLNDGAKNLLSLLAENGRLTLLPEIVEQFEELKAAQENTTEVVIASAFDLSEAQQEKLSSALKNKLNTEISITTEINKDLVGGVVIRAGDLVIDGSVRGKLAKLAEAMNS